MVLKTTLCRFSGLRIYPGSGMLFIRVDGTQYILLNRKVKSLFHQRKRAAKLAWTFAYRKAHKKDVVQEGQRKRRRTHARSDQKSIVGASLDVIRKMKSEKPEVRQHQREAQLREVKERVKKTKQQKQALKAQQQQNKLPKNVGGKPSGGKKGSQLR